MGESRTWTLGEEVAHSITHGVGLLAALAGLVALVVLTAATRDPKSYKLAELGDFIAWGASPRATLALLAAARAHAFLQGRGYVVPEDVKSVAPDVLRHRVLLTYEAEAENVTSDQVVARILERVEVP